MNDSIENSTYIDAFGNFTTDGYEDVTNETTTNASVGIECREDQFLCEALNKCINNTFMCDGIADCPDSRDEFECKDSCQSNFMCGNSSICIMNEARCDGIWDCENGTDEENCIPNECAKHEVMCLDGSKCIKPGHICDWQYNCLDRSDEVGCVERTTCESGKRFFCNDGLCIPWSLKCDGEHDCKDGEDEGNCTCLHDEFQCNDGKCLKSSSRCDGHQDCQDADDEMGCVNVDSQHIVSTYEPYSGTWGLLCAEDWNLDDGQHLCQELGFGHVLNVERTHVSFNGTWMAMRRENLTDASLWTERVSFVESCTSGQAAAVECQKFVCGEYTGLLHRRRRDTISSSSSQWPFIGYTSTFHSNKGCLSEILTPIWLITSAECLLSISKQPFNGSDWYVRTNIGRQTEMDVAQNHEVLKIITHPHSSKFRSLTLRDYDVAMIRLKHALVFVSDKIGAICPPDEQVPPGITCFSGVLGTEKPRAPPPQELTINSLALQLIDRKNCNSVEHFNNTINHRMLCTQSSEGHTICDNDEGTPLMCLTGINKWFLAGMLTYQRFCDVYNKHPAVFSNLFSMRKFLDQVTGQKQYEIPSDNNVYSIIPPTTPSPTLPETTTYIITTAITTELDTLSLSTIDFENITGSGYDAIEEFNGTTVAYEELAREENDTATISEENTPALNNVTDEMVLDDETVTPTYGTEFDFLNATSEEVEVPTDEIPSNETHSYFTSLLNDTSSESINATDIFTTDEVGTKNETLPDIAETTTVLPDSISATIDSELDNTSNVNDSIKLEEIDMVNVTNTALTDTHMNVTGELQTDMVTVDNVTHMTDDSSVNSELYNLNLTFSNLSRIAATDMPLVNTFNESVGIFEPVITLEDGNISISQPLISLIDDSTESLTTLGPSENSTENILLTGILNETLEMTQPITEEGKESLIASEPSIYTVENSTLTSTLNDSTIQFRSMMKLTKESISTDLPLINVTNDTTLTDEGNTTSAEIFKNSTEDVPWIGIFEESREMIEPSMELTNKSESIILPLTLAANNTAEMKKASYRTLPILEFPLNNTEDINLESVLFENNTNFFSDTMVKSATPTEAAKIEMSNSPISDATNAFSFEIEGEPDEDLAFSIFRDSDGLKFEPYREINNETLEELIGTETPSGANTIPITAHEDYSINATETQAEPNMTTMEPEESRNKTSIEDFINITTTETENKTMTEIENRNETNVTEMEMQKEPTVTGVPDNSTELELKSVEDINMTQGEILRDTNSTIENAKYTNVPTVENLEDANMTTIENPEDNNMTTIENLEGTNMTTIENSEHNNMTTIENAEDMTTEDINMTTIENSEDMTTEDINMTTIQNSEDTNMTTIENPEDTNMTTIENPKDINMTTIENPKDNNMTTIENPEDTNMTTIEISDDIIMETTEAYGNTIMTTAAKESEILITLETEENTEMNAEEVDRDVLLTTKEPQEDANITVIESLAHSNETFYSTSADGLITLLTTTTPVYSNYASNAAEINVFESDNSTAEVETQSGSTTAQNYTIPVITEIASAATNISDENYDNFTVIPKIETNMDETEDPSMKIHLMSEGLTILPNNKTECGNWDYNFETQSSNISDDFFLKWPALGYLQMISEPQICPSAVVSSRFVITSLNCLTLRDPQLDPDKWTYIGGSKATSSGLQSYTVKEMITYPNPGDSPFLNEHDVALVKVKDVIKMDNYSKTACLAEDTSFNKECFVAGWNKNVSDNQHRQFHSIPLTIISTEECNNARNYDGILMDYLICGVYNTSIHACKLDYGSPLFCPNDNQHWEIHGVLNFPSSCDKVQPLVFSSFVDLKKWMTDTLQNDTLIN